MSTGKVFLVGAGPGDPGLLTVRAANLLRSAGVVLYDALASDWVVALAPPSCEKIFVGKRGGNHAMTQDAIEALMVRKAREHAIVVRLKGGDPFVFGRGGEEAQTLAAHGIPFEIVPGITSVIAAPAYAGIPLTHRDHNPAFTVATGHEDPTKPSSTLEFRRLADPHRTLVFLMAMGNLREIARTLVVEGLAAATPVAVIQDGTRPTQRTVTGTLTTIADDVEHSGIGAPAIVVVGSVVRLRNEIAWFDRTPLFGKRVLITRPERQAHDFANALIERGVEPILAPAIVIGPPDDPRAARRAVDDIGSFAWVVFTSQNGVDAFFARLHESDRDARALAGVKIAAIGSSTASRLQHYGLRADLVPATFVSEAVGDALIAATASGDRVLIYRAQEARDVLPAMLERAQRAPTVVAAYKTAFARDPDFSEKVARADVLTFTSASTVHGFAALLGGNDAAVNAARGKCIACIGPITRDAAQAIGLHVDVLADVFTADGLLAALAGHYASTPHS